MIQDICTWYKVRMEIPNLLYVQCIYRAMHENYERGRREMRERERVEASRGERCATNNDF